MYSAAALFEYMNFVTPAWLVQRFLSLEFVYAGPGGCAV